LPVGSHVVYLGDMAPNCSVDGENPRAVTISADRSTETVFEASCAVGGDGDPLGGLVAGAGIYENGQPSHDVDTTATLEEIRADGPWSCTVETHRVEEAPDDYATFNPNAEVIYPGSMLQGATLVDATPEPIVVRRAGGTVVINLLNGSPGVAQHVDEVKQSTVVQAVNDILAANTGIVPARFTYTSSEVQSREQLALELGVNVSTLSLDFRSKLSFSTDKKYNRFLVQMNQSFYTVSFDLPRSLDELFAPDVTVEDLEPYMGPGNPPTYISSVTYGRRFFLLIESTASVTDMRSAIQASYDAAVVEVDVSGKANYVKDLSEVNIKVFALGGDQSRAAAMFNGDLSALQEFLTDSAIINTGVPLSYVVRNVADNGIVSVKVATDYDVKTCIPLLTEALFSGFADNDEGWTSFNNGTNVPQWQDENACGNGTGGCIRLGDATNGAMEYRAPYEWRDHRDWSRFYGGTINYYMRVVGGDSWGNTSPSVILESPHGVLTFPVPDAYVREMGLGWKLVTINLDDSESSFNTAGGPQTAKWQFSGRDATAEEIEDVLSDVTDFRIRADMRYSWDWNWLDEVQVQGAVSTP